MNRAARRQLARRILEAAEAVARDPERFTIYRHDPEGFFANVLDIHPFDYDHPEAGGLTEDQLRVVQAVNTSRRVTVRSGHGTGKTFVAALIVVWWLLARRGKVITTASSWNQVELQLWKYIAAMKVRAKVDLPGKLNLTEWVLPTLPPKAPGEQPREWFAVGFSTDNPTVFQGHHHPDLLVIVDEAPGVDEPIHETIQSTTTGENNCLLYIGNPTEISGSFYESHRSPMWTKLHLDCYNHPNVKLGREVIQGAVTVQWIAEVREKWGEEHDMFGIRVRGRFPKAASDSVIGLDLVERMMDEPRRRLELERAQKRREPIILSVDVARYGDNRCVMTTRQGPVVTEIEDWGKKSTTHTAGKILAKWRQTGAQWVIVDGDGLGAGVVDILLEKDCPVLEFRGGMPATDATSFADRRSELWWEIRLRAEKRKLWLPKHEQLTKDLTAPTYRYTSSGQIKVMSKEEMRKKGIPSPDFADSVLMSFAADGVPIPEEIPDEPGRDRTQIKVEDTGFRFVEVGQEDAGFGELPAGF